MKTKPNSNPASKGGTLKTQLDAITAAIETTMPADAPERRFSRRQRCGIEALRRYLCGSVGVKASEVTDAHVAKLALKIDWGFTYKHNFYLGHQTLEEIQIWAKDLLAGREVAK